MVLLSNVSKSGEGLTPGSTGAAGFAKVKSNPYPKAEPRILLIWRVRGNRRRRIIFT
jgi:hypothetical protein